MAFLSSNQMGMGHTPYSKYPVFFRVSCRPSTRKGGVYHGKPGFPKNTLKQAGILSRGYALFFVRMSQGITKPNDA